MVEQEAEKEQQLPSKPESQEGTNINKGTAKTPLERQTDPFEHNSRVLNLMAAEIVNEEEAARLLIEPDESSSSSSSTEWHSVFPPLPSSDQQKSGSSGSQS